jgi:acetylornithine/N-succinyldiaminopimelate aminotransferase
MQVFLYLRGKKIKRSIPALENAERTHMKRIEPSPSDHFFNTYTRLPLAIEYGKGMFLYGKDGTRYLDMFSGLAVNALGYGHQGLIDAVTEQMNRYVHLSNFYTQESQNELARLLVSHTGYRKVFLCNSGTEAIEGALKIARLWGNQNNKDTCVSMSHAFHGRSYGALSLTDQSKYRNGFGPFLPGVSSLRFNSIDDLQNAVNDKTAALFVEPIQGEGGINPLSRPFVDTLKKLQQRYSFLIIADEIQSGLGRTGTLFACEHFGLEPDMVTLAKPVGGGLPLGAILGNDRVADILQPGMHGTTFGGNPVACAAGAVVIKEIMENGLLENARTMGNLLRDGLRSVRDAYPVMVRDVRGFGLMIGMELDREGETIVRTLRDEHKILINCTAGNVLRFLPPLIVETAHIEYTVTSIKNIFKKIHS